MSKARQAVQLMHDLGLGNVLKEMLHEESGFASALSRSLPEQEVHLVLDLVDLGWAIKTPVSFLKPDDMKRLREILLENAEDPSFDKRFMEALKKPPIDQVRLFEAYNLQGAERGAVIQIARSVLLESPALAMNPNELSGKVEALVKARFQKQGMSQRVVSRFVKD
jgi:hypothetical protein